MEDLANVDFSLLTQTLGVLTLLLIVDVLLGAASAFAGGSFKWEYLYAVGRTKGLVLFQVAVLMFASSLTSIGNFTLVGLEVDPFILLATPLGGSLALSLLASIKDNIGKSDTTAPQGVAPVEVKTPPDKT